jgi:hypothetical protein
MIATSNLALRFVLEIGGLAALAYAGFQLADGPWRWLAAVAAPLLLALFWAFVVAPNAANPIAGTLRELIGSLALLAAAGALAASGQPRIAMVFTALVVANNVVLLALGSAGAGASR